MHKWKMSVTSKSFLFTLSFFVVLLLLSSLVFSSTHLTDSGNKKIDEKVLQLVQNNDSIDVMIKYKTESKMQLKSQSLNSQIDKYAGIEYKKVSLEELAVLQADETIEKVSLSHPIKASLQQAVSLIQANKTWALTVSSINLTGTNGVVCIIDTGINFSHPAIIGKNKSCIVDCFDKACIENCSLSDDNGHGTHVAGIVAASGGIYGVAFNSSLIGVRVLDSAGSGSDNDLDISRAIDYCVAQNVSVISMSLGTATLWNSNCDSDFINPSYPWATSINDAFAKNISVVVAAGNDGNSTHISAPACITNATPVGMSYDANVGGITWVGTCTDASTTADKIVCASNRNFLVKLFAPGALINSTWNDGSYAAEGGTSMATPMVAGAIAIMNQYLNLTNQRKTPKQIETILWQTGVNVPDSQNTSQNFSRIDIYAALLSLNPVSTSLISPENNNFTNINFTNFNCSSQTLSNYVLKNITFYLWNSTNSLVYNETKTTSGTTNSSIFNYTFTREENYKWNCLSFNNNSDSSWASFNNTITYDITAPIINLTSPANDSSYTTADTILFSYNIVENFNISNCSLIANNLFVLSNLTIGNFSSSTFSKSFSAGDYNWSINCSDSAGNQNFSEARNFTVTQYTSPSGGGGSSGGSGSSRALSLAIADNQMLVGYTQPLAKGNKLSFRLQDNSSHSLTLAALDSSSVNLTLASNPFNVTLVIGQELKINLSSAEYYDLYLKLNSIANNKANITIKSLYEVIVPFESVNPLENPIIQNDTKTTSNISDKTSSNNNYIMLFTIVIVIVIVLVLIIMNLIRKPKNKSVKKKK